MKELSNLIDKYGKETVIEELLLLVEEDNIFDRFNSGWCKVSNYKPELNHNDIDISKEMSLLKRDKMLDEIVWDEVPYIESINGMKLDLEIEILPNGKVEFSFGYPLKGTLKTDFLVMYINKRATKIECMGGDIWKKYYVEIDNQRIEVSFGPNNMSSVSMSKSKYYDRLVKDDGSRRQLHKYLSFNRDLEKKHEVYGDQSLMLGSIFDDEVFNAYQEAKEIVEIYERRTTR